MIKVTNQPLFKASALTKSISLALVVSASATSAFSQAEEATPDNAIDKDRYIERIQIVGQSNALRTEAGSATYISEVELEKFQFDDINRVLYNIPGVNIREEDGFGLRPNIGFRGVTPERSKKITIMEDGVLIGPAPYSAPSAYYFPMTSKMTAIEVFKGPAATKYGPNTVAGALNMVTRQIPTSSEGEVELGAGTFGMKKASAHYGDTVGKFGYLIDAVHLEADGFKELDGGGDTGFKKNDIMAKFNYELTAFNLEHLFELKLAHADEKSNETYLGLTDADFAKSANRRYVASQLDNMDWTHQQFQLTHFMMGENFDLTTKIYRNNFERSWFKVNGFKGGLVNRDLQEILANPEDDTNALFYEVLTGARDSEQEHEKIIVGDNAREYYSQGIQSELHLPYEIMGMTHNFNAGFRFHKDQIQRNHTEDLFLMRSAMLESDGSATKATTTNLEETEAIAIFLKDTVEYQNLNVTVGIRGEFIDSYYQNRVVGKEGDWLKKKTDIWLPSLSMFYSFSETFGLLFGVHEGFIPTSPKESPDIDIENSVNYEFGGRYNNGDSSVEAVAFFNDINNLKESCTFSAASSCGSNLDQEFNGGEVDVYGLELTAKHTFSIFDGIEMPLSMVYTFTESEFKTSFESDFPMWGKITKGDKLPYLPENQLTLNASLIGNDWDVNLSARYIGEMLETSGTGEILSGVKTKDYITADISASYQVSDSSKVFVKATNLLDEQEIVSRRPYGARPNAPRMVYAGYKYSF